MKNEIELTTKIVGSAATTGGIATASGFLSENATLIGIGFTAATFLVYCFSVWQKGKIDKQFVVLKKKALALRARELETSSSDRHQDA